MAFGGSEARSASRSRLPQFCRIQMIRNARGEGGGSRGDGPGRNGSYREAFKPSPPLRNVRSVVLGSAPRRHHVRTEGKEKRGGDCKGGVQKSLTGLFSGKERRACCSHRAGLEEEEETIGTFSTT